jgi:hypothetical protein
MWCGDEACEIALKEQAGVTSRCIPFEQEQIGHTCAVCGATELTDPNLEFRVARNGEEYCIPHLPAAAPSPG